MSATKIIGGPGSGKTTRLIQLIKDSGVPINKVAYCTIGTRALGEMRERMMTDHGSSTADLGWFKTIHAINFNLLGIKKDSVADGKLAEFCKEKRFTFSSDKNHELLDDIFYKRMQEDRNDLRPFDFVHPRLSNYTAAYLHFKKSYFEWMIENDYIDYVGMIEQGIEHAVLPPVDLICIDEWQDLNPLQIKQINMWAANIKTSYHAGDDDQCISEWTGADPYAFLQLSCDNEIMLNQSFRLPSDILALSQYIITKNKNRKEKDFFTNKGKGGIYMKSMMSTCDSLKKLPKGETCYFLIRNNFLYGQVAKKLIENGMPMAGLEQEKKAIRLMIEGSTMKRFMPDDVATLTAGSIFPATRYFVRGSKVKISKLLSHPFPEDGYTFEQIGKLGLTGQFFEDLLTGNIAHLNISTEDRSYILKLFKNYGYEFSTVKIMTIHASKGLEADTIVIVPYMASRTSKEAFLDQAAIESERRVWYTAITRAKKRIVCLTDTFNGIKFGVIHNIISDFSKVSE